MTLQPAAAVENLRAPSAPRFVARQPILKTDEKVFAYELLFRDGIENQFKGVDPENASRSVLDSSLLMGLDMLCDGRRAFINCTRGVLLNDYMSLLPPRQAIVEILETITVDDDVVAACRSLKNAGYLIALDDFVANDPRTALTGLADIIKVDFRLTAPRHLAGIVERCGKRSQMLAEKVETQEEFRAAKKLGFVVFSGLLFLQTRDAARQPALAKSSEPPPHVAGRFAAGTESARDRGVGEERAFHLLPLAALPQFVVVWVVGRDSLRKTGSGAAG